ncbi:helix-turn-helix domain-containing protein [Sporolactobacillus terrae]|nr:helix-turn-helix domain-containing protein [Sporolactobacillus terrae]UAK16413.1 AraC family transcriptional regulator [Sporolactobacillus terrae]
MTILWISGKVYNPKDTVNKHKHNFYQLQLLLNGRATTIIDKKTYHLFPNEICIIKKNKTHEFSFTRESVVVDIKFIIDSSLAHMLNKYLTKDVYQLESGDELKYLLTEARSLDENSPDCAISLMALDSYLKYFILRFIKNMKKQENTKRKLSFELREKVLSTNKKFTILDYMQKHYSQPITLNYLSNKFSYSKNYIIKLFKDNLNLTPIQALQIIRIEQAKSFLEYTHDSIELIANKVGMEATYFTKLFTRYEKVSPRKYRSQIKRKRLENITLMKNFDIAKQPEVHKKGNVFIYSRDSS